MSFTPYSAPILSGLLGDPVLAKWFSVQADFEAMLRFEAALAAAEAEAGVIPGEAAALIAQVCAAFRPDLAAIGAASERDGLAVPEFVRQLRAAVGEPHGVHVHFGATSQDVIDTSLILRLREANGIMLSRLADLNASLERLSATFGARPLMARTRMQAAIPITVGDRIENWRRPLREHPARYDALSPRLMRLQFGGAAGTLEKLGEAGRQVSLSLAEKLGLAAPEQCWHTDRSAIADYANWLSLLTGGLGKIGQDIVLMAQNGIGEIALEGGGGSSAMPHKQNPVKAEALVTLARFNAALLSAMHHALVHEQERSGAAWTLEWMVLPQMCMAAGASLRNALALTGAIYEMGSPRT